ncbi:hypothetical protein EPUL_001633 [Erysiphe pulchra]|uniref:protein-tyrosine-phosphatase n=1 Tax=Erysiphe pulchra TaxID=225359 RepID=A0A2S4PX71_9PEZI|nr:hypothetical protein EPUL_001633 [Erysiphe pulchra]
MTIQAPKTAHHPTRRLSHSISNVNPNRSLVNVSQTDPSQSPRQKFYLARETQLVSPTCLKSPSTPEERSPSPSYFGLIVDSSITSRPSDICPREIWCSTASIRSISASSPMLPQIDNDDPEYEAFRKRANESHTFNLGHSNLSIFASPKGFTRPKLEKRPTKFDAADLPSPKSRITARDRPSSDSIQFDLQQGKIILASPRTTENIREDLKELCLPAKIHNIVENNLSKPSRSIDKINLSVGNKNNASSLQLEDMSVMAPASKIQELIEKIPDSSFLLLDLRVFPQYSQSRIKGALNLCIPTTLLKRPSFNLQKLSDTFTNEEEKEKFSQWPTTEYIIMYDASSTQKKDSGPALNTLKKFSIEGWKGTSYILQGGFKEFSKICPSLIDCRPFNEIQSSKINLSLGTAAPAVAPVAGGCLMPLTKNAANPFFSNIRQNQDLIGGVGQMDIKIPSQITTECMKRIPKWLSGIAEKEDHGKRVSHKYLRIEQEELATMTKALSSKVCYGTPSVESKSIRLAGIEKGSKNRYNNIWPYEHSRVKLLSRPDGACDYVNASHIKASRSNKRYIASQGPLPATFEDFWSVIWEQGVQVIVMLTAEKEGGQLKCHDYWSAQSYGQYSLKVLSEKQVPLEVRPRNEFFRRRATTTTDMDAIRNASRSGKTVSEGPHVTIRKFALSHTDIPLLVHEITQIHYSSWPDFGAPANPCELLGLVELCDLIQRTATSPNQSPRIDEPEGEDTPPMLVHCSAGCGRTGTFCTIDSVIDILKRQRKEMNAKSMIKFPHSSFLGGHHSGKIKNTLPVTEDCWTWDGDMDLVEKTVEDFRSQRLSMVQNLRQFVLCYETVLEWVAQQVTRSQKPSPPVLKSVSKITAFEFNGGRDRCGSVF